MKQNQEYFDIAAAGIMKQWNEADFKRDYPALYTSVMEALEALREDAERLAFKTSQELMKDSKFHSDLADQDVVGSHRMVRNAGMAAGFKYAAYKLREAFGLPKSSEPDRKEYLELKSK